MQWERHPRESEEAYQAFILYRDQKKGDRSCARVGQELGKSKALIERWSSAWNWRSRVAAWDEHLQGAADEAQIQAVREMNARHAASGIAMQNKAMERLLTIETEELTPEQLLRLIEAGISMERTAMGADKAGLSVSLQNGQSGASVSIYKLYAGLDMKKFQTAHVGTTDAAKAD